MEILLAQLPVQNEFPNFMEDWKILNFPFPHNQGNRSSKRIPRPKIIYTFTVNSLKQAEAGTENTLCHKYKFSFLLPQNIAISTRLKPA